MSSDSPSDLRGRSRFSRSLKTEEFSEQRRISSNQPISSSPSTQDISSRNYTVPTTSESSQTESSRRFSSSTTQQTSPKFSNTHSTATQHSSQRFYAQTGATVAEYPQTTPFDVQRGTESGWDEREEGSSLEAKLKEFLSDQVTPIRLASHLAVLAVAAVVLIVSQVDLPDWQLSLRSLPTETTINTIGGSQPLQGQTNPIGSNLAETTEAFQRAVVPFTESQIQQTQEGAVIPAQAEARVAVAASTERTQIETYTVKTGDTVLGIAARHGLQPETIQWANPELEANPDLLRIGDRLVILPVDGALHVVQPGDTLSTIAARYKASVQDIVSAPSNNLTDVNAPISVSTQLIIPNGTKPYIPRQVATYSGPIPENATQGSGNFGWPSGGIITQPFWNGHRAIDVGGSTGTPVTAADSGYVITSRTGGWNSGYGNMVMVDHGNGYVTLYAHLNSIYVRQGENISKGQQLGTIGNTGNSTGPHLHFEVRYQGVPRNPFSYLP